MKHLFAAAVVLLVTGVAVRAGEADKGGTQELYDRCIRNDSVCGSFLMGVASVQIMLGKVYQDPSFALDFIAPIRVFAICPKKEPINGNLLRQRLSWAEKKSQREN